MFHNDLTDVQKGALVTYCEELEKWNKKLNLTALSGAGMVRRLIAEPVWIARKLGMSGSLVDIGSGNGSPGIPFQIVCSFRKCHLIEARLKRAAFLRHMITKLNLKNEVQVHRARFESVAGGLGDVQWISLQAVALTSQLIDSIRTIASPTTTIVWITSHEAHSVLTPLRALHVPITGSKVFLFQLDLS